MLERDTGKYLLYYASIRRAVQDSISRRPSLGASVAEPLVCVVVGGGMGRLPAFCLDVARELRLHARIAVADANPKAVEALERRFAPECTADPADLQEQRVYVHPRPFLLHPDRVCSPEAVPEGLREFTHSAHVFVAEFLGGFGDNEFFVELMNQAVELFASRSHPQLFHVIPCDWYTYVAPIYAPGIHQFLSTCGRSTDVTYAVGLHTGAHAVAMAGRAYGEPIACAPLHSDTEGKFALPLYEYEARIEFALPAGSTVHGFGGYFTSLLWRDEEVLLEIDSRCAEGTMLPDTRNSWHWETWWFPLAEPLLVDSVDEQLRIMLLVRRKSRLVTPDSFFAERFVKVDDQVDASAAAASHSPRETAPSPVMARAVWYEWQVLPAGDEDVEPLTPLHNADGRAQTFYL